MSFRIWIARTVRVALALGLGVLGSPIAMAQQYPLDSNPSPRLSLLEIDSPTKRPSAAPVPRNHEEVLSRLPLEYVSPSSSPTHLELTSIQSLPAPVPTSTVWQPTPILNDDNINEPLLSDTPQDLTLCGEIGTSCCNSRIRVPPVFHAQANHCPDANCWLTEFYERAASSCSTNDRSRPNSDPQHYRTWWDALIQQTAGFARQPQPIRVGELIQSALLHSPHVQVAATAPHIRRTFMVEEQAAFDWRSFLETKYDDTNDPVGNTLTTGNNDDRFKQREFYARGGLRRTNRVGGDLDISQRVGTLRNNSRFLLPPDQGNSRLELNYTQPLLNGHGRYVNESLFVLATIDYNTAGDQFLIDLQDHLLLVTEAYWELYRARANYFQRRKLLHSAQTILENLRGRAEVDSLDRQVLRATAAVASRKSEIARAVTSIRNAESQLRLLVNDPAMLNSSCMEFLPVDQPLTGNLEMTVGDAISTALGHRPDISQAIRELRATTVRLGVAKNDLLPQLDLLVSTYVAGLNGNKDIYASYVNQFSDGRPGFSVGLQFEVPIGNRAARARHERRKWELTRALGQFRAVAESAMTDVEVSVREVSTTYREMMARYEAMLASSNETDYLVDRWKTLPNVDDSSTLLLEDLLDSQARLTDEEDAFVQAQVNYAVALVKLRQSMGTSLQVTPIQ